MEQCELQEMCIHLRSKDPGRLISFLSEVLEVEMMIDHSRQCFQIKTDRGNHLFFIENEPKLDTSSTDQYVFYSKKFDFEEIKRKFNFFHYRRFDNQGDFAVNQKLEELIEGSEQVITKYSTLDLNTLVLVDQDRREWKLIKNLENE